MIDAIERWLEQRGVTVREVAEIVLALQLPYNERLTIGECEESVRAVLGKREVLYTMYTGIALDELAEQGRLPYPLQQIMETDESLYGVDETLALGIVSVYGMIGLTSFGYLDKMKPGVIDKLNGKSGRIHVFLDDLVAGLAAAASARIAHQDPNARRYGPPESAATEPAASATASPASASPASASPKADPPAAPPPALPQD